MNSIAALSKSGSSQSRFLPQMDLRTVLFIFVFFQMIQGAFAQTTATNTTTDVPTNAPEPTLDPQVKAGYIGGMAALGAALLALLGLKLTAYWTRQSEMEKFNGYYPSDPFRNLEEGGHSPILAENFIGRVDALKEIVAAFERKYCYSPPCVLTTPAATVFYIFGQPGVGKKELARQYADQTKKETWFCHTTKNIISNSFLWPCDKLLPKYQVQWWIRGDDIEHIKEDIRALAQQLYMKDSLSAEHSVANQQDVMSNVKGLLSRYQDWLLIFSDVSEALLNDIKAYFPAGGHILVLVTTESGRLPHTIKDSLHLGGFDEDVNNAPAKLFQMVQPFVNATDPQIDSLYKKIDGNIRAWKFAASYISDIDKFVASLASPAGHVFSGPKDAILALSNFHKVHDSDPENLLDARTVFNLFTFVPGERADFFVKKAFTEFLLPAVSIAVSDQRFKEAIRLLIERGFIESVGDRLYSNFDHLYQINEGYILKKQPNQYSVYQDVLLKILYRSFSVDISKKETQAIVFSLFGSISLDINTGILKIGRLTLDIKKSNWLYCARLLYVIGSHYTQGNTNIPEAEKFLGEAKKLMKEKVAAFRLTLPELNLGLANTTLAAFVQENRNPSRAVEELHLFISILYVEGARLYFLTKQPAKRSSAEENLNIASTLCAFTAQVYNQPLLHSVLIKREGKNLLQAEAISGESLAVYISRLQNDVLATYQTIVSDNARYYDFKDGEIKQIDEILSQDSFNLLNCHKQMARIHRQLAEIDAAQKDTHLTNALSEITASIDVITTAPADLKLDRQLPNLITTMARILIDRNGPGDLDQAEACLKESHAKILQAPGLNKLYLADCCLAFGMLYLNPTKINRGLAKQYLDQVKVEASPEHDTHKKAVELIGANGLI